VKKLVGLLAAAGAAIGALMAWKKKKGDQSGDEALSE
jgi:hypothetical protein